MNNIIDKQCISEEEVLHLLLGIRLFLNTCKGSDEADIIFREYLRKRCKEFLRQIKETEKEVPYFKIEPKAYLECLIAEVRKDEKLLEEIKEFLQ